MTRSASGMDPVPSSEEGSEHVAKGGEGRTMRNNSFRPTDLNEKIISIEGYRVRLTTYCLGETYYCSVDNIDPGAVVCRGAGMSREEAESAAMERAKQAYLSTTKG